MNRESDDGAPYPGCKEFWYTYKIVNPNSFEFEGETTKLFKVIPRLKLS
jgi:hypothetical protein